MKVTLIPASRSGLITDAIEIDLDMDDLVEQSAESVARELGRNVAQGRDANSSPLPPVSAGTSRRRARQGASDLTTPLHATGKLAASFRVERDGQGGAAVVLETDAERQAAVDHYGAERLAGVPARADDAIDKALSAWADKALRG